MIFSAIKQDGKVVLTNRDKYQQFIDRIKDGTLLHIEVKRKREKKTPEQNAYLHLSVRWLGWECGMTEDQMKDAMKMQFSSYTDQKTGLQMTKSWAALDTEEEAVLIDKIDKWAIGFLGYGLPPPKKIDEELRRQR